MTVSRRALLSGAAAGAVPVVLPAVAAAKPSLRPERVLKLFSNLPGTVAVKIYAPAVPGKRGVLIESGASQRMFVGSAIKTFALCEALRRDDSPDVVTRITDRQLALNESVWNLDSASFNPPNLAGKVTERTVMEAMICHSDDTATDMLFKFLGPARIRKFIAQAGLKQTMVPDSTRVFFGYILGAKNYKHFTWQDLVNSDGVFHRPPLNDVETLASSADDLVSYYSRALRGKFFKHPQTLSEFREILAMGDAIWLVPVPLGVSAFVKGGSIDTPGFHAVCVPGGMLFNNRWVFFALTINWNSPKLHDDATVAAFLRAASQALTVVMEAL
jgi:beta-lactamase class A